MAKRLSNFLRDIIGRHVMVSPRLRRLMWRVGRSLYCLARGEQRVDDMRLDGELDLQHRVHAASLNSARFVAFDIGANQGDWTLALIEAFISREGNTDRLEAHAFEPVPATRERLTERVRAMVSKNVHISPVALSDRTGSFDMAVMSDTGGTNSLVYDKEMARQALGFVPVELTTLDLYCAEASIDHIHIVKCDTEGNDLAVMRGAAGLLAEGRIDVFQFEYNQRWINARAFLKDVFELVEALPYRVGRVMPESIELFDSWHPELERFYQSNYVLIREPSLHVLNAKTGAFDDSNSFA
ncbi:FkbM family methyltransferase [Hoeflea sp.]|uniref:FkbM family methyltransferase n=1 Tax=Hoeflea sp. TaxID=1940281 RepID=UPI0019CAD2BD|nr:FkbM family methyltransferase [Hoeflea sp.]MBC7284827.1 FkbM family methyltransferase [Hoeflea sp.]